LELYAEIKKLWGKKWESFLMSSKNL
jgi:hypothetical protein